MKLLVTGGAGFIGSNFIRHWLKNHTEDEIFNLDKLTYAGNPANLADLPQSCADRYHFYKGDICDPAAINELACGADGLVHFAAESHVTRSEKDPHLFERTNVEGTRMVLAAAKRYGLNRVIHVSTDEVYGSKESGYFKEEDKEPGDGQASSPYSKSKARADDIAQSYFNQLPIMIVRPTNNFGFRQYPEKALARWLTSALTNQPVEVWGEGQQVRDWLFVEDTARAIDLIWHQGESGTVYNIGANHSPEITNLEIAKQALRALELPEERIRLIPDPRPDHDFRYAVDTTRLQALGWRPGNFERQLRATAWWYRDNPQWWRPLKPEAEALYAR